MLLATGREVVSKTSAYNITKLSYRVEVRVTDARKPANYKHIQNALYVKAIARKATPSRFHVGLRCV